MKQVERFFNKIIDRMMNQRSFYDQFLALEAEKYDNYLAEYEAKLSDTTDEYRFQVHSAYLQKIYDTHKITQGLLKDNTNFISKLKYYCGTHKTTIYQDEFNERLNLVDINKNELIDYLAESEALSRISTYLRSNEKNIENPYKEYSRITSPAQIVVVSNTDDTKRTAANSNKSEDIKWQGNTELEFVQLIYALFEAGYLSNQKNQVTTLVKQIALLFNYKLGKHWQSNLSEHVHGTNNDHVPEIFQQLPKGFQTYKLRQINSKKKNNPKQPPSRG